MDFKVDSPLFDSSNIIRDQADFKSALLDAQNFLNIQKMSALTNPVFPSLNGSPTGGQEQDKLLDPILKSFNTNIPEGFEVVPVSDYEKKRYNDPRLGFIPGLDPVLQEDRYAKDQSSLSVAAHFLPKLGFEIVNKIGQGIGSFGGILTDSVGLTTAAKYDNAFLNLFDNLSEFNKDYFRTYASKEYATGSILNQLGTGKFWDDDVLDGLAFLTSAIVPGLVFTKLGKLASVSRLATVEGAASEAVTAFGKLSGPSQSIGKTLMGATNVIAKGINKTRGLAKFEPFEIATVGNTLLNGSITTYNTLTEAAIEGRDTYKRVYQDSLDQGLEELDAKKAAKDAADNTFWWNTAALILPNYIQTKAFFGKTGLFTGVFDDIKSVRKAVAAGTLSAEDVSFIKEISKNIGISMASEGLWEENIQQVIQNLESSKDRGPLGGFDIATAETFISDMINGISYFGRGITGEVLPTEQQEHAKAILLGGLIGIIGGAKAGVQGAAQKKGMIEVAKLESRVAEALDNAYLNAFVDDMRIPFREFEVTNPDGTKSKTFVNPDTKKMEMDYEKASKIIFSRLYQTGLFSSYLASAIDNDPLAMTMIQDQALGLLVHQFLNKKYGTTNEAFYETDDEAMDHLVTYLTDGAKQSDLQGIFENSNAREVERKVKKMASQYRESEKLAQKGLKNFTNTDVSFSAKVQKAIFYEMLKQESLSEGQVKGLANPSFSTQIQTLIDDSIERIEALSTDRIDDVYTEYQGFVDDRKALQTKYNDLKSNPASTKEEIDDVLFKINELHFQKGTNNKLSIASRFSDINNPNLYQIGQEDYLDYAQAKNYVAYNNAKKELADLGFDITTLTDDFLNQDKQTVDKIFSIIKKYIDSSVHTYSSLNDQDHLNFREMILNLPAELDDIDVQDLKDRKEELQDSLFGFEDPVDDEIVNSDFFDGILNPSDFPTKESFLDYIDRNFTQDQKDAILNSGAIDEYYRLLDSIAKFENPEEYKNIVKRLTSSDYNEDTFDQLNQNTTSDFLNSRLYKPSFVDRDAYTKRLYAQKFIDLANQLLNDFNRNKDGFANYAKALQTLNDINTLIRIYEGRPEYLNNAVEFTNFLNSVKELVPKLEEAVTKAKENDASRLKEQKDFETFHDEKMWNQIGLSFFDDNGVPSNTLTVTNPAIWNKVVELVPEANEIKDKDAPNHPNKPFNRAFVEKILQKIKALPTDKVKELQDIIKSEVEKYTINNNDIESVLEDLNRGAQPTGELKSDGLLFGLFDVSAINTLLGSIKYTPNNIINIFKVTNKINDHRLLNKLLSELLADPNKQIELASGNYKIKASDLAPIIVDAIKQEALIQLAESLDSKYDFVDYLNNQNTSASSNEFALNAQQEVASHEILKWIKSLQGFSFATLFGPAGTGKTSLIKWVMKAAGLTNDNTIAVSFSEDSTNDLNTALGTTKKVNKSKDLVSGSLSAITDSINTVIIDEIGVLGEKDLSKLYENLNTLNKSRNARNIQSVKVLVLGDPTQLSESSNLVIPAFYKFPHMSVLGNKIIPFLSIPYRSDIQAINQAADAFRSNGSTVQGLMVRSTSSPGAPSQGVQVLSASSGIKDQLAHSSVTQAERVIITNNPTKYDDLKASGETVLSPSEVQGKTFKEVYVDIAPESGQQPINYNTKMYVAISRATDYAGYVDYTNTHQNVTDPNIQNEILADRLKNLNEKANGKSEYGVKIQVEVDIMGGAIATPGTTPGPGPGPGTNLDPEDETEPEDEEDVDNGEIIDDTEEEDDLDPDEPNDGGVDNPVGVVNVSYPTNETLANYGPNQENRGQKGDAVIVVRTQKVGGQPMYRVYKKIEDDYLELGVLSVNELNQLGLLNEDAFEATVYTESASNKNLHSFVLPSSDNYLTAEISNANGLNYSYGNTSGFFSFIENVITKVRDVFRESTDFTFRLFIPTDTDIQNNKFRLGAPTRRLAGMPYLIIEHKSSTGGPARTQYVRFNPKPINKDSSTIQTVKKYHDLALALQQLTGFTPESEEFGKLIDDFADDLSITITAGVPEVVSPIIGSTITDQMIDRLPTSLDPSKHVDTVKTIYDIAKLLYGVDKRKGTVSSLRDFYNILKRDGIYSQTSDPKTQIIIELKKLQKDPTFTSQIGSLTDDQLGDIADKILDSDDLRSGNILMGVFGFSITELGGTTSKLTKTNPIRMAYRSFRNSIVTVSGLGQPSYTLNVVDPEDTSDSQPYNNRNKIVYKDAVTEELYSTYFPTLGKGELSRAINILSLSNKKINEQEITYSFNYTSNSKTKSSSRAKPLINLNSTKAANNRRNRTFYHLLRKMFTEGLTEQDFNTLQQKNADGSFVNELGKYVYKKNNEYKLSKRFDLALDENRELLVKFLSDNNYLRADEIKEIYNKTKSVMPFSVIEYLASDSNYDEQGFANVSEKGIFVRTGLERNSLYSKDGSTILSLGINDVGEAMANPTSDIANKVMEFVTRKGFRDLDEYIDSVVFTQFEDIQKPSLSIIKRETAESPTTENVNSENGTVLNNDLGDIDEDIDSVNC